MSFVKTVKILIASLSMLVAMPIMAQTYVHDFAYIPLVSSNPGAGGSYWQTEVTILNVQSHPLTITHSFYINGTLKKGTSTMPANSTATWRDYVKDAWSMTGIGSLNLDAETTYNPGYNSDCLGFVVNTKLSNVGSAAGSFSSNVPGLDILSAMGTSWPMYFSGVNNYGTAGVDGHRTNVGLTNWCSYPNEVTIKVWSATGGYHSQNVFVSARSTMMWPVPIQVERGAVMVRGTDALCVAPYLFVIDNKTSDASYFIPTSANPSDVSQCSFGVQSIEIVEPRVTGLENRLERLREEAGFQYEDVGELRGEVK